MKPELRIGVVDSGHSAAQRVQVIAGRRFSLLEEGLAEGIYAMIRWVTAAR